MRSDSRVLDVGSGTGRVAMALTPLIAPPGSYDGLDINQSAVAWCRAAIGHGRAQFRFHHVDLANTFYKPRGAKPAETYRFPFGDGEFDVIIVASVFTHMLPGATAHYLSEIGRVMGSDGRCFCTGFFYRQNDGPPENAALSFPFLGQGYALADRERPEAAVAYEEEMFRRFVSSSGMEVDGPLALGSWRDPGAPRWPTGFQDHFVLRASM